MVVKEVPRVVLMEVVLMEVVLRLVHMEGQGVEMHQVLLQIAE